MTLEEAEMGMRDATRAGWIAFFVSVVLTLVYMTGGGLAHLSWLNIVELILLPLFSLGIGRKNRWAALLMLVYYLGSKVWLWVDERALIGVPLALIFGYFFWQGVRGAFTYHHFVTTDGTTTH